MNKLFLILLVVSVLFLSSCQEESTSCLTCRGTWELDISRAIAGINTSGSNSTVNLTNYYNKTEYWINATNSFLQSYIETDPVWNIDKSSYYTKLEVNAINTTMKNYVDSQSGSSTAQLIYFDEFTYYAVARTNGIGICAALSSGTAAAVTDVYMGTIRFSDSTTANGGFQCRSDATSMYFQGGEKLSFRFKLANRATNIHQFGFSDSTTAAAQVDGCTINGANLVMTAVCRNNNAQTANATTYTLTALTWYSAEIEALSTTQVRFRIYNADKSTLLWSVTVSSNVPNTAARAFGTRLASWETSVDAAAIMTYFDYVKLEDTSWS